MSCLKISAYRTRDCNPYHSMTWEQFKRLNPETHSLFLDGYWIPLILDCYKNGDFEDAQTYKIQFEKELWLRNEQRKEAEKECSKPLTFKLERIGLRKEHPNDLAITPKWL